MAVEAYVPSAASFAGKPVAGPVLVVLHDADGPSPCGSLTAAEPISAGCCGRLAFEGTRDGKLWSVTVEEATVTNHSAAGCEFTFIGSPRRTLLAEFGSGRSPREKGFEERFDIR